MNEIPTWILDAGCGLLEHAEYDDCAAPTDPLTTRAFYSEGNEADCLLNKPGGEIPLDTTTIHDIFYPVK